MASRKTSAASGGRRKPGSKAKVVDDVFIRHRIERLIEFVERERLTKGDLLKALASHPLLTMTIAFIPLIIFGVTFYNDSIIRHQRELFEQQSFYQGNISSLSKALASRNERAVLLRSALIGNLGTCEDAGLSDDYRILCKKHLQELIYERKKDYDSAYLQWNSNYPEYLFNIGRLFKSQADPAYKAAYKDLKKLVMEFSGSALREMDSCLTNLYGEYQRNGVVPAKLPTQGEQTCSQFDTTKNMVRECGVVLAEQLHHIVTRVFESRAPDITEMLADTAATASTPVLKVRVPRPNVASDVDLLNSIRVTCHLPRNAGQSVQSAAQP